MQHPSPTTLTPTTTHLPHLDDVDPRVSATWPGEARVDLALIGVDGQRATVSLSGDLLSLRGDVAALRSALAAADARLDELEDYSSYGVQAVAL